LEPFDRLHVVTEDVRSGGHHRSEGRLVAVEVRDEDIDARPRRARPQAADRLGKDRRSPVGQVISGDRGDHDVLERELRDRRGDTARLVVGPGGPAGLHRAEPASPGSDVAQDHDRRRPLAPAFADILAAGLPANGVELQPSKEIVQVPDRLSGREGNSQPFGVPARRERGDTTSPWKTSIHEAHLREAVPRRRVRPCGSGHGRSLSRSSRMVDTNVLERSTIRGVILPVVPV
jgi:hypothetical protein